MAKSRRRRPGSPSAIIETKVSTRTAWWWLPSLSALLVFGAGIRIWAAQDAFWLDEIWSLREYALPAESPVDILARMPDSNNHHLVTLWMYFCGLQANWSVYRIPSLIAGVGTIGLASLICRRWGDWSAMAAALLCAGSFVLVTYASEARGYALTGFFALAAFWVLSRYLDSGGWAWGIGFGILVALGFLSHLTMIFFYAGAVAWSLVAIVKRSPSWRLAAVDLWRCHAVAVACLATFYLVSLRHYRVEGAPPYVLSEVVGQTFAVALGVASKQSVVLVAASAVAITAATLALVCLWRQRNDVWVFFAVTVFVAPGLLLLTRPSSLFERFFYVCILFYLLLLSYLFGRLVQWGRAGQLVAIGCLALVMCGNGWLDYRLLAVGRGHYPAAMQYLAAHSSSPEIHVQSDDDFRNPMILAYYGHVLLPERKLAYHAGKPTAANPAEWTILHSFVPDFRPPAEVTDGAGTKFEFKGLYPYWGLSGFHWALYRRAGLVP